MNAEFTIDDFLGGKLKIRQPAKGFRAGLDAVMLAASVPDCRPDRVAASRNPLKVLDAGAGVGTAGLCVAVRSPQAQVTLAEKSPILAGLAAENIEANGLTDRIRLIEADILASAAEANAAGLLSDHFDEVIANPPYLDSARHRLPDDPTAAGAFGMATGELERWARFMARVTAPGGHTTIIHRADALAELLAALSSRFGRLAVLPLHPREGEPAHRVIIRGKRGSRAPMSLLPGLILHGQGNAFLPAVVSVLRDGAALPGLASSR